MYKSMSKKESLHQKGFVSIIVAATVMIILSLITIGFTRIMQREQREALDRQLTRQATYAAESGINTVWQFIKDRDLDAALREKEQCSRAGNPFNLDAVGESIEIDGPTGPTYTPSPYFDGDTASNSSVQITCILYDKNPPEIKNQVSANQETIFPFEEKDNNTFSTITISWEGDSPPEFDAGCTAGSAYDFPQSYGSFGDPNSGIPVLRLDLYNTSTYSRDSLANSANYFYLIPCNSGTTGITVDVDRNIYKENIDCSDSGKCTVELNVGSIGSNSYFIRHKLLYGGGEVKLGGTFDSGNRTAQIKGAQSVIDVTARASDVVRRLRVNIPYGDVDNIPGSVVGVGSGSNSGGNNTGLCKQTFVVDGVSIEDDCRNP